MTKFENMGSKLNEEWQQFQKQFEKVGNQTAKETAGAAAEVLKGLAKELGVLGEKLEKWVESAKRPDAPQAASTEQKSDTPPAA
jgi:molecular chaperone GrpE (heat shock protein)